MVSVSHLYWYFFNQPVRAEHPESLTYNFKPVSVKQGMASVMSVIRCALSLRLLFVDKHTNGIKYGTTVSLVVFKSLTTT